MSQQVKVNLYRTILAFAIADVALGIAALFCELFPLQLSALLVTTITLVLSVVFTIIYPRSKRTDIVTIVVGGLDFITTLISVLVVVMATQLLAVVASGFTLLKAVKIFVQSEKARRLLDSTKPLLLKLAQRFAPAVGVWLMSKKNKIKQKIKGDKAMEKVKQFLVKMGQLIRANKISLAETVLNGGVWGAVGYLVSSAEGIALEVCGVDILPYFSIIGFVLVEIAFQWESFGTFMARISPKLAEKVEKKKALIAEKDRKNAEKERERLIAEMKAEKAAAEKAEKEAKAIAEKEAKELAEKEAKEAAEKAEIEKRAQEDKELAEWLAKKQQA